MGGINKKNINKIKITNAYGFSGISYFLIKNYKNENKNISQQIQILINQFNAKNFDLVIKRKIF